MTAQALEQSVLESKDKAQLLAIAEALGVERALTWSLAAGTAGHLFAPRCTKPLEWLQWARPGVPRVGT